MVLDGLIQREVIIQLFTLDDTAIGKIIIFFNKNLYLYIYIFFVSASEDYDAANVSVIFVPDSSDSRSLCSNISVTLDDIVEDMEEFFIFINTTDSNVAILQPNASILIVDNTGK